MAGNSLTGWLPIEIGFDAHPAIVPGALVRWMEFGSTPLAEPFLSHTVDKLRTGTPPARELETDLDTLQRWGGRLPSIRPAGFIFHISRCGSTLIANGLKTSEDVLLVSESRPLSGLLRPFSTRGGRYTTARWTQIREALLKSLFSLFAHYRTGRPEPLFIKFTSVDILSMSVVRSLWPEVPCVVVVRDPVEVMVASLSGGGWMSLKSTPELACQFFGWADLPRSPDRMTDEEFSARVLGRYFAAARDSVDEKCMIVDYEDLNPKRVRAIAAHFGVELPTGGDSLEQVFRSYAKDPNKRRPYQDDRARKQALATSVVRGAAYEWATPGYTDLRGRGK